MPGKPLVIFDGDCGFCRIWIEYWRQITHGRVDYARSQECAAEYPQIPQEKFAKSVQLLMPDGDVMEGARAVYATLTYAPGMAWLAWLYDHCPGFAPVSEAAYRLVAANRNFFYRLTRLTFGRQVSTLAFAKVEWLFLRAIALIYFIAFTSLLGQVSGLIGDRGILPVSKYLAAASQAFGARAYWLIPTLCWVGHSDLVLRAICIAGAAIAVALFFGLQERVSLVGLYVLYLSLSSAGQDFLSFQWDALLLEAGFLAIFLGSSKWVVLLFRWLLFRLMFLSGFVKLASHDPNWRNLSAMSFHYLTQPLPTPIAWYMYQLPLGFQRFSTGAVLGIELAVPFLVFAPRPWRTGGAVCLISLQALIFLTGNYTFFNLLAVSLCLFLFDDARLERLRVRARNVRTRSAAVAVVTVIVLTLSFAELSEMVLGLSPWPVSASVRWTAPFEIVNTYGLFAVMTTSRPEIVVQGSQDGITWLDYAFPFKPGDVAKAPRWAAPYQPRLDWQMWFAALGDAQNAPWFTNFLVRLLEGSPQVDALLASNPFPNGPPKYVRARLFDYTFTDSFERRSTGAWWRSKPRGLYFPAISLADLQH